MLFCNICKLIIYLTAFILKSPILRNHYRKGNSFLFEGNSFVLEGRRINPTKIQKSFHKKIRLDFSKRISLEFKTSINYFTIVISSTICFAPAYLSMINKT